MAPYFAREIIDFCGANDPMILTVREFGTEHCHTMERVEQYLQILQDTTFYLIDSPIKINPTGDYLSIAADLTIEAGVEVIVAENKGIS